eukprot:jgi/Ulvmu1/10917/UM007_0096.1
MRRTEHCLVEGPLRKSSVENAEKVSELDWESLIAHAVPVSASDAFNTFDAFVVTTRRPRALELHAILPAARHAAEPHSEPNGQNIRTEYNIALLTSDKIFHALCVHCYLHLGDQ